MEVLGIEIQPNKYGQPERQTADMYRAFQRRCSRKFWEVWCNENLQNFSEVLIDISSFDIEPYVKTARYQYCDDTHINVKVASRLNVGLPTCFVTDIRIHVHSEDCVEVCERS